MRRILIPSLALLVIGVLAMPAVAGNAANLMFPFDVTWLEDQDWELAIFDVDDTDGILDSNDFLVGMFEVTKGTNKTSGGGEQKLASATQNGYTGVFVLQPTGSSVVLPSGTYYHLGPVADWGTNPTLAALGLATPTNNGNTIAMVYDNSHYGEGLGGGVFLDPTLGLAASLDTATRDSLAYEFGFTPDKNEFWITNTLGFPPLGLQFYGSLNVTYTAPGSPVLLDHDWYYYQDLGAFLDPGDVVLGSKISQVHLEGGSSGLDPFTAWDIITDTDFYVKATPEPGTLALLGLGLVGIGGVVYRRRRNK